MLISVIITAVLYLILYFVTKKRKNREGLKIKEKEDAENMFLSLACNAKRVDFFVNALLKFTTKLKAKQKKLSYYVILMIKK